MSKYTFYRDNIPIVLNFEDNGPEFPHYWLSNSLLGIKAFDNDILELFVLTLSQIGLVQVCTL